MAIDANEARRITSNNLKGPAIKPFVSMLEARVKEVASKGGCSFDPWACIRSHRGTSPSGDQREAIRKHFEQAGFVWEDHPDPDPGHPASRPYTTLSW